MKSPGRTRGRKPTDPAHLSCRREAGGEVSRARASDTQGEEPCEAARGARYPCCSCSLVSRMGSMFVGA